MYQMKHKETGGVVTADASQVSIMQESGYVVIGSLAKPDVPSVKPFGRIGSLKDPVIMRRGADTCIAERSTIAALGKDNWEYVSDAPKKEAPAYPQDKKADRIARADVPVYKGGQRAMANEDQLPALKDSGWSTEAPKDDKAKAEEEAKAKAEEEAKAKAEEEAKAKAEEEAKASKSQGARRGGSQ